MEERNGLFGDSKRRKGRSTPSIAFEGESDSYSPEGKKERLTNHVGSRGGETIPSSHREVLIVPWPFARREGTGDGGREETVSIHWGLPFRTTFRRSEKTRRVVAPLISKGERKERSDFHSHRKEATLQIPIK